MYTPVVPAGTYILSTTCGTKGTVRKKTLQIYENVSSRPDQFNRLRMLYISDMFVYYIYYIPCWYRIKQHAHAVH